MSEPVAPNMEFLDFLDQLDEMDRRDADKKRKDAVQAKVAADPGIQKDIQTADGTRPFMDKVKSFGEGVKEGFAGTFGGGANIAGGAAALGVQGQKLADEGLAGIPKALGRQALATGWMGPAIMAGGPLTAPLMQMAPALALGSQQFAGEEEKEAYDTASAEETERHLGAVEASPGAAVFGEAEGSILSGGVGAIRPGAQAHPIKTPKQPLLDLAALRKEVPNLLSGMAGGVRTGLRAGARAVGKALPEPPSLRQPTPARAQVKDAPEYTPKEGEDLISGDFMAEIAQTNPTVRSAEGGITKFSLGNKAPQAAKPKRAPLDVPPDETPALELARPPIPRPNRPIGPRGEDPVDPAALEPGFQMPSRAENPRRLELQALDLALEERGLDPGMFKSVAEMKEALAQPVEPPNPIVAKAEALAAERGLTEGSVDDFGIVKVRDDGGYVQRPIKSGNVPRQEWAEDTKGLPSRRGEPSAPSALSVQENYIETPPPPKVDSELARAKTPIQRPRPKETTPQVLKKPPAPAPVRAEAPAVKGGAPVKQEGLQDLASLRREMVRTKEDRDILKATAVNEGVKMDKETGIRTRKGEEFQGPIATGQPLAIKQAIHGKKVGAAAKGKEAEVIKEAMAAGAKTYDDVRQMTGLDKADIDAALTKAKAYDEMTRLAEGKSAGKGGDFKKSQTAEMATILPKDDKTSEGREFNIRREEHLDKLKNAPGKVGIRRREQNPGPHSGQFTYRYGDGQGGVIEGQVTHHKTGWWFIRNGETEPSEVPEAVQEGIQDAINDRQVEMSVGREYVKPGTLLEHGDGEYRVRDEEMGDEQVFEDLSSLREGDKHSGAYPENEASIEFPPVNKKPYRKPQAQSVRTDFQNQGAEYDGPIEADTWVNRAGSMDTDLEVQSLSERAMELDNDSVPAEVRSAAHEVLDATTLIQQYAENGAYDNPENQQAFMDDMIVVKRGLDIADRLGLNTQAIRDRLFPGHVQKPKMVKK